MKIRTDSLRFCGALAMALLSLVRPARGEGMSAPGIAPVELPDGNVALFEDFRGQVYVAVSGQAGGIFTIEGSVMKPFSPGPFGSAVVTSRHATFDAHPLVHPFDVCASCRRCQRQLAECIQFSEEPWI